MGVTFTTLLCHDEEDRAELCLRTAEISGLKRVLVLTHNKEVRDLKASLQSALGLRTYSVQRSTSNSDRERALSEFLESRFGVLVAMDAYTGIDLMDVDAVIQYYPPQKSMPDEEWDVFTACLRSTGSPASPTLVVTIAAPDDLSMVGYFFKKLGIEGAVMNLSSTHVQFADLVRRPEIALAAKVYGKVAAVHADAGHSPPPGDDDDGLRDQQGGEGTAPRGGRRNGGNAHRGGGYHQWHHGAKDAARETVSGGVARSKKGAK